MDRAALVDALRSVGARITPQRLVVLDVITSQGGHLPVDEVYQRAKEFYPYMDIATVYRTLQLFKTLGVVTEVAMGDRRRFEHVDPNGRHYHMVCRVCDEAFDLDPHYLEELRSTLQERFEFAADVEHLTITGACAACRRQADAHATTRREGDGR